MSTTLSSVSHFCGLGHLSAEKRSVYVLGAARTELLALSPTATYRHPTEAGTTLPWILGTEVASRRRLNSFLAGTEYLYSGYSVDCFVARLVGESPTNRM
jgi:hypothetical protein